MSKIIELSTEIIPKIAAGEVVERPVSVVKELVENALDASAKNIVIETEQAGIKKIKVVDDGEGMSKDDLNKCFLPHTTSKLQYVEDLALIKTLGFRGEALASICAVADLEIKSNEKGKNGGYKIVTGNSKFRSFGATAMSKGTTVEVNNLFSYVPARKKFLKSVQNENQLISNLLTAFALAHVSVGFEYYRDGKQIFKVLAKDKLSVRIEKLLGLGLAAKLLPLNYSDAYLKITGYITKPQAGEPTRNSQYLFVNKRVVDDLQIAKTVKEAYKNLLDVRSYPPFVLNIELDWGLVDVNVHPQKEHVKFWNDTTVRNAVFEAVTNCLKENDLTYVLGETKNGQLDKKAAGHLFEKLKDKTPLWNVRDDPATNGYNLAFQIADTYVAYPVKNGLVLIDQHAAHESILYEQLLKNYKAQRRVTASYTLTKPEIIQMSISRLTLLEENLDYFAQFGFDIEKFGKTEIRVNAIPEIYKGHDLNKLILEMLDSLVEGETKSLDEKTRATLAFLACRSAIKAGDKLSKAEIKRLLLKLDECWDLYTCPHGRPLKINITSNELARMFKRIK